MLVLDIKEYNVTLDSSISKLTVDATSPNPDLAIYAVYRKIGSQVGNAIDGGFTNYITEKGFSSEEE